MILDVTIAIVLGKHKLHPYKMVNLINVCVLAALPTGCSLVSLPLLRPLCSLRHNNIEISPFNNPTVDSKFSCEKERLTLNQKLEIIELSEEGMSKVEIG